MGPLASLPRRPAHPIQHPPKDPLDSLPPALLQNRQVYPTLPQAAKNDPLEGEGEGYRAN